MSPFHNAIFVTLSYVDPGMNFFLSSTFGLLTGCISSVSVVSLVILGHLGGAEPDVATACFVGLLCIIASAFFMTFLAAMQRLTS